MVSTNFLFINKIVWPLCHGYRTDVDIAGPKGVHSKVDSTLFTGLLYINISLVLSGLIKQFLHDVVNISLVLKDLILMLLVANFAITND